jgi:hypothetical protein
MSGRARRTSLFDSFASLGCGAMGEAARSLCIEGRFERLPDAAHLSGCALACAMPRLPPLRAARLTRPHLTPLRRQRAQGEAPVGAAA